MSIDMVHFGNITNAEVDWRKRLRKEAEEDDDEVLAESPQDVVDMLGFDPLELEEEDEEA